MFGRQKIAALVAEFLGAGALTLLVLTVVRSSIGQLTVFVAAVAAVTYMLMNFVVGNSSGGQFNPALTLGLWTARKIETVTAVLYVIVQLLGAWAAYGLYTYIANTSLSHTTGHFEWRIFVAEMVGTAVFAFAYSSALWQGLTRAATAAYSGLGLLVGIMIASTASFALLNPAVALGVRSWVWGTYVLGPIVGAVVGVNLYGWIFAGQGWVWAMPTRVAPAAVSAKPAAKRKTASRKK